VNDPAQPTILARIGRVLGIMLIFVVVGPPIGGIVFMMTTALIGFVEKADLSGLTWIALLAVIYAAPLSYLIGTLPAAAAGLLVGLWQAFVGPVTWLHALAAGLVVGLAVIVLTGQRLGADGNVSMPVILITCLVPTLVCWLIVRGWHIARTLAGQGA
jgi:hypothetical protein